MSLIEYILLMILLIFISIFFSLAEISIATSRKVKLQQMMDEGNKKAEKVLQLQNDPGSFFTVVQIGLNVVVILAGILGDTAFTPYILNLLEIVFNFSFLPSIALAISVSLVTASFILFADIIPKRLAMIQPEKIAIIIIKPTLLLIIILKPLVWFFNNASNWCFKLLNLPTMRKDDITSEDILAMMEAGTKTGELNKHEYQLVENVFEMETRTVSSAMTPRENLVFFTLNEDIESIKTKIENHTHNKFLICESGLDKILGYVDTKDILIRLLTNKNFTFKKGDILKTPLVIPDTLTLYEVLEHFKFTGEDFAIIINEYALVVGIVTLKDVMSVIMGELVSAEEEQIIKRDNNSWLIDGLTPIADIMRVLEIDEFPDTESYETIAGFMMYSLRKIPKRTDFIIHENYKFEVVDIDNYKIDQLLVTKELNLNKNIENLENKN